MAREERAGGWARCARLPGLSGVVKPSERTSVEFNTHRDQDRPPQLGGVVLDERLPVMVPLLHARKRDRVQLAQDEHEELIR